MGQKIKTDRKAAILDRITFLEDRLDRARVALSLAERRDFEGGLSNASIAAPDSLRVDDEIASLLHQIKAGHETAALDEAADLRALSSAWAVERRTLAAQDSSERTKQTGRWTPSGMAERVNLSPFAEMTRDNEVATKVVDLGMVILHGDALRKERDGRLAELAVAYPQIFSPADDCDR